MVDIEHLIQPVQYLQLQDGIARRLRLEIRQLIEDCPCCG
jgi:hypothetical protein